MNIEETRLFVKAWNNANGFKTRPESQVGQMIVSDDGIVSFNEYDTPDIKIKQFVDIYDSVTTNALREKGEEDFVNMMSKAEYDNYNAN